MNIFSELGYECVISDTYKVQKKTHKNKIINWFYRKIFGYKEVPYIPEGVPAVVVGKKIIFRDKEFFESIMAYQDYMTGKGTLGGDYGKFK